jgi:hypothetical protein
MSLKQVPRSQYDRGNETARKTAVYQAQFIAENYQKLVEYDKKSKPQGWKVKRFREMSDKLNKNIQLDNLELNYMDEFYEAIIAKVYNVPSYKKEFYKGHRR